MVDSVNVFPPGQRLTNSSTGAPLSGAVVRFYVAGTTTPKTVYADQDLTTALGTSVTTDSLGYPTSDGSTKTLVFTDTSSYKVRIETSAGALIAEHDYVKAAVEAGTDDGGSVISTRTVETKSLDYTVVAADQGKAFAGNCTGGDVTFTLPSAAAADVGNGWLCTISHAGTANQVIVATSSSQTITSGALGYSTAFALSNSGEEITLISDGGNWRVFGHVGPHIKRGQGVLTIADRLAAAPGSPPEAGLLYIATGAATWGSTSIANHDVVVHTTGGAYVKITPPTDCGWVAYVQDEDRYYSFQGSAWVIEEASETRPGTVEKATAAEVLTATDATRYVAPVDMLRHPGVAKAWGIVTYAAGVPTLAAGLNVASITDTATGRLTVTVISFSSANYVIVATAQAPTGNNRIAAVTSGQAAGSFEINVQTGGGTLNDPEGIHFACYGTLS
ncbi:MAG: hypothetical protein CTY28_10125 [Hyphomicrobium sp.]|nr:MAG: hypothetical protein CTY28_10125 [Hyphomicrobium sp.]